MNYLHSRCSSDSFHTPQSKSIFASLFHSSILLPALDLCRDFSNMVQEENFIQVKEGCSSELNDVCGDSGLLMMG